MDRGHTCRVNVGKRWEGKPARHRALMAGVKGSCTDPEDRSLKSVMKGKLDQHRSSRQATCSHGVSGTQGSNCVLCMFQDSANFEPP